jgi:hypothetical protein
MMAKQVKDTMTVKNFSLLASIKKPMAHDRIIINKKNQLNCDDGDLTILNNNRPIPYIEPWTGLI